MEAGINVSGYTNHITQLCKALIKSKVDLGIESSIHPSLMQYIEPKIIDAIKKPYNDEITVSITRPESWAVKISDRPKKFYGYLVFEGSKIPYTWKVILEKYKYVIDGIIVPSEHVLNSILNAYGNKEQYHDIPIYIVPEGVNTKLFKPIKRPKNKLFEFLFMGGWAKGENDRKGLDIALKAFTQEFDASEPVVFSAKVNISYAPKEKIINDLKNLGINTDAKNIRFGFDTVPEEVQAKLYQNADAFVMPTKAEGFGLTIAEAMACGLPTIATNYGGHLDFFSDKVGYPIEIDHMCKATDSYPIYEDAEWAIPSIESLRKQMRYVYEHQDEAKAKGKKAARLMKKYSWENSAKKLLSVF